MPPPAFSGPAAIKPSFDIVRVSPAGDVVVAGRAAPGADVALTSNGRAVGRTTADAHGQFVILPSDRLASGGQEMALSSVGPTGDEVAMAAPILVFIPDSTVPATAAPVALAVMAAPDAPPRLLQGGSAEPRELGLDIVDYDERGAIRFAGTALPNVLVRLYVDDVAIGEVQADATGRWNLTPFSMVVEGPHRLRLDQVTRSGFVGSRIELRFQRSASATQDVPENPVVVQPQQNLWRIAHRIYGHGVRYTEIYQANRNQIRDPNLIFPGQILSMPAVRPAPLVLNAPR